MARDVGVDGIFVNAVAPGPIETETTRGFAYPVDHLLNARLGTPEDVAESVVFLASPASNHVTGQVLCGDGGWVM